MSNACVIGQFGRFNDQRAFANTGSRLARAADGYVELTHHGHFMSACTDIECHPVETVRW